MGTKTADLSAIDLFCGCGGLTTGLKRAGFHVLGAVDVDALAVESYQANHPEVHVWHEDIVGLSAATIMEKLGLKVGELDLLAGCPPCQGFSALRTLNGHRSISDSRNDLIFEFLRLVRALEPKSVMLENVPALVGDGRLTEFQKGLEGSGYKAEFKVLDAADYGVPQRRKRLILLAGRLGTIPFCKPAKTRKTVRDAISHLPQPRRSKDPLHRLVCRHSDRVKKLIKSVPRNGGSRQDAGSEYLLDCHRLCDGFFDVYGRMAWDDVAPTITTGCVNPSRGRFIHPRQDRAITLREAALLQTFPAHYAISLRAGKYPAATLVGNALPPEFIRRHANAVRKYLQHTHEQRPPELSL